MFHDQLKVIGECLDRNREVAAWMLPGSDEVTVGEAEIGMYGVDAPVVSVVTGWEGGERCRDVSPFNISHDDYIDGLRKLIDELKETGGKIVISRAITCDISRNIMDVIRDLFIKGDRNTFRFIYFSPALGGWLGMSPELLLKYTPDGMLSTMSLAGTRPSGSTGQWDDKNIEEHDMVTRFIVGMMRSAGLEAEVGPMETVGHGPVEHIRHIITARGEGRCFDTLLRSLSPTPALAGIPRDVAMRRIASIERHDRRCYGGYVSVKGADGSRYAYVNLRSMSFVPGSDSVTLYAGGGITAQSDPETEWAETLIKAQTLSGILSL